MKKTAAAMTLMALAGCALGIQEGGDSPQVSFEVDRPYRVVHARAVDQANQCLLGDNHTLEAQTESRDVRRSAFVVKENLDDAARQGEITVSDPLTGIVVARTRLKAVSPGRTAVTQTVWGRGTWDGKTLNAMHQSVVMDASICTVYKIAD